MKAPRTPSYRAGVHLRSTLAAVAIACGACRTVGEPMPSITGDISEVASAIPQDIQDVFGDGNKVGFLAGMAALAQIPFIEEGVEDFVQRTNLLDQSTNDWLASSGDGIWLFVATGLAYTGARLSGDTHLHQSSKLALRSLTVTGITTLAMKAVFQDPRPDGRGTPGFPSGHSAMCMAFATSVHETYGWKAGVPAYLLALGVGVQRLDSRRHDWEDVLFGWSLGYIITSTIFDNAAPELSGFRIVPAVSPETGFTGLGLSISF